MVEEQSGSAGRSQQPVVTGLSPTEGMPGTQITIRGENLGNSPEDLMMLFICGTDCLLTAKWKSPSKIVARLGQANRGVGEIQIATRSGGRGLSHVKFRVFIAQIGPLEESAVWVDESRTVPGRDAALRNAGMGAGADEETDVLGLKKTPAGRRPSVSASGLASELGTDVTSNLRMESFSPALYLLENHADTSLNDLRAGLRHLTAQLNQ